MNITTLGCDPEVFLRDAYGNMISSVGRVGGTKENPRPISDDGCAVQEDNVAVEFNTPPCKTVEEFRSVIRKNLTYLSDFLKEQELEIAIQPSAVFDDIELDSMAARTFGCDPDFDAWKDGAKNPRPRADNPNLRSAGGHIHIGVDDPNVDIILLIKWMDVYVGCQLLRYDTDKKRRELYGKPGAFRKKRYGVEYRTPSNVWISNDDLIQFVWDQTDKALARAKAGDEITEEQGIMIQQCINESDLALLEQIENELGK